jgi:RNA polymerase sigma factor (sigma-70 family)
MATSQMSGVIQHLRRTVLLQEGAGPTDGQLLEDYISRRDEAALAALVHRHGPMVWGVCRRVLRNYHDAEDAFQATFLVFVRKVASIASRELVANWLYGVAHQTALKARATAARRKERERQVTEMPEAAVAEQGQWHDLQPLLDEELSRLPEKYRAVIVLCDLAGKTRKEVAHQLDCPEGTVAGRLSRARVMLAKRLAQRGVVLSGGALAAVLSQNVAWESAPSALVSSTIKAASVLAAGRAAGFSARVAALTEGTVKAMFMTKIKSVLAVMLVATVAGAVGLIYQSQAGEQPMAKEEQPAARKDQKTGEEKQAQPKQQPAHSDQERIVGGWVIMNADSKRQGEQWLINKDHILRNPNLYGFAIPWYFLLDATKDPKQIDMTAQENGPPSIKGIYVLDGDELRLCLGDAGKDRPAAFPQKPRPGEVLILHRYSPSAEQPKDSNKVVQAPKPAEKEQKVLTPEEAIKQRSTEEVTVQLRVTAVEAMPNLCSGFGGPDYYVFLKDGGRFTARMARAADQLMRLGIDPVKHFSGKVVRVTGRVEPDSGNPSFMMWVVDLTHIEVMKE